MRHTTRYLLHLLAVALVAAILAWPGALEAACETTIDLGRGPVRVVVPDSYDPDRPAPLAILLHGYGSTGDWWRNYLKFDQAAESRGMVFVYPDGSVDWLGNRFWNATDVCCDYQAVGIDDATYVRSLIDAIGEQCNIDYRRIYFIGHSNGGFMSYRMACDYAPLVAAVVSLAGGTYLDPADCRPSAPVHVLQIHGTEDVEYPYEGSIAYAIPTAVENAEIWAGYNRCAIQPRDGGTLDLDRGIPGQETDISRYDRQCKPGGSAELWTVWGAGHEPSHDGSLSDTVTDFLLEHQSCRGRERLAKIRCDARRGRLKVKLRGAFPNDPVEISVRSASTHRSRQTKVNRRGNATVVFRDLDLDRGEVTVEWNCSGTSTRKIVCR